jgi:hypothetical protein
VDGIETAFLPPRLVTVVRLFVLGVWQEIESDRLGHRIRKRTFSVRNPLFSLQPFIEVNRRYTLVKSSIHMEYKYNRAKRFYKKRRLLRRIVLFCHYSVQ